MDYRQFNETTSNALEVSESQIATCNNGAHIILEELKFKKPQDAQNKVVRREKTEIIDTVSIFINF
jgi:hypothetical protein